MPKHLISEIEKAELAARQTVQNANENTISLIRAAREKAAAERVEAVREARAQGETIIRAAQEANQAHLAALDATLAKEMSDLASRAARGESAALAAVMEIIGGEGHG